MRGASAALPLTAAALLAACGGRAGLEPAPGADVLPAPREGARASAAGVTLTAEVDAWTGVPENLEQALPEGVLAPGGRITGFLYFEELEGDEGRVDLRFDLVDARSRCDFGPLSIPSVVR